MTEDRELIKRTLAGERRAFDEVVARYQDGLFRHLLRLTGKPEEAEDLCQEAFIGLYRSLRRFNPERPLIPFLFTIATNAWKKRLRGAGREVALSYEEAGAGGDPVAEKVFARLEYQQILTELMRLQPEQREAVSLFYDQGLSYREISGITGAPVGTVSARLKRGLDTLRQALAAGGAGLVIPAGVGELPQYLTSILQGQATAPGSLVPAVAHGIATLTPAGAGVLTLWKGALVMNKAIYVAIGLVVVGGAVVGVPRLMGHQGSATNSPGPVEIAKTTTTNLSSPSPKNIVHQDEQPNQAQENSAPMPKISTNLASSPPEGAPPARTEIANNGPGNQAKEIGISADLALRPLPADIRASFIRQDPRFAQWIDQLNGVYASLPVGAKEEMLTRGEYAFHLSDLPEAQADIIRNLIKQDIDDSYTWLSHKVGSPPNLETVVFKFGRYPEDPTYVRFMITDGKDSVLQPEIGLWPSLE
jgi:RNA polymerase sigma-70 factor, ECF subfamily